MPFFKTIFLILWDLVVKLHFWTSIKLPLYTTLVFYMSWFFFNLKSVILLINKLCFVHCSMFLLKSARNFFELCDYRNPAKIFPISKYKKFHLQISSSIVHKNDHFLDLNIQYLSKNQPKTYFLLNLCKIPDMFANEILSYFKYEIFFSYFEMKIFWPFCFSNDRKKKKTLHQL